MLGSDNQPLIVLHSSVAGINIVSNSNNMKTNVNFNMSNSAFSPPELCILPWRCVSESHIKMLLWEMSAYWFNSISSVSATRWIRMGRWKNSTYAHIFFFLHLLACCEFTCSHFLTLLALFPQLHVVASSKSSLYILLTKFVFSVIWVLYSSYIVGVIHCYHVIES